MQSYWGGALTESKSKKSLESLESCKDSKLSNFEDSKASLEFSHFANNALSALALNQMPTLECKWQEFKIGELFEISTTKKKFDANKIKFGGSYPYVARGDKNNGIRGYINEDIQFLNPSHTISFGQDTATMFYQGEPYFTGDKIKIMSFKSGNLNRVNASFLIGVMRKAFLGFSWGSSSFSVDVLKNATISLPVYKDSKIAFDVMESFIKAIEKAHIQSLYEFWQEKLNAYESVMRGGGRI